MVVATPRTCFRCGGEFKQYDRERLCPACRRPEPRNRRSQIRAGAALSPREKQVARLVAEGKLNKQIGAELHLTEGTIKEYLNRIFRKLAVGNRSQLAVWTIRNNP